MEINYKERLKSKRKTVNKSNFQAPVPFNADANAIESDHHLLISKVQNSEMIPYKDETDIIVDGIFEETLELVTHKLYIGEFMEAGKGFYKIINKLQEADKEDELELHISSYGGSVSENIQLYNLINSMYSRRCTAYLNHGYSGGAMAFMMAKDRIIYKHSDIMFHFFSGGEFGKVSDMLGSLQHSMKSIASYYKTLLKDFFSEEELDLMVTFGKEYWFDSKDMMNKGIATGIILDGIYYTREEYFIKYDKEGEIKEEWLKEQEEEEKAFEAIEKKKQKLLEKLHKDMEKLEI